MYLKSLIAKQTSEYEVRCRHSFKCGRMMRRKFIDNIGNHLEEQIRIFKLHCIMLPVLKG